MQSLFIHIAKPKLIQMKSFFLNFKTCNLLFLYYRRHRKLWSKILLQHPYVLLRWTIILLYLLQSKQYSKSVVGNMKWFLLWS